MKFRRWYATHVPGYCCLKSPKLDHQALYRGELRAAQLDLPLTAKMSDDFPDDIALADNCYGAMHSIVSQRVKTFLEENVKNRIEFIPVEIINHKGHTEPDPYFLLNPLDDCDCIDQEASEVEWSTLQEDTIDDCDGLVFEYENIPDDYTLFRLKYWESVIMVREDLAQQLEAQGFTGLYFPATEGYDGIG